MRNFIAIQHCRGRAMRRASPRIAWALLTASVYRGWRRLFLWPRGVSERTRPRGVRCDEKRIEREELAGGGDGGGAGGERVGQSMIRRSRGDSGRRGRRRSRSRRRRTRRGRRRCGVRKARRRRISGSFRRFWTWGISVDSTHGIMRLTIRGRP